MHRNAQRTGMTIGRVGNEIDISIPILNILYMSLFLLELFEEIFIPSLNNSRRSLRVPYPQVTDTFLVFDFNIIILK